MCGRFSNAAKKAQLEREFKIALYRSQTEKPRYNVAPGQMIEAIVGQKGERLLEQLKWGLIPSWAKDADIAKALINARAETLSEKPSFREAFLRRRCIIPATGFYEWRQSKTSGGGGKQPFYFYLSEKPVFGFAALYEERLDKRTGDKLETCTIITTRANEILKPVHDRMPVILKAEDYDLWLDEKVKNENLLEKLLAPYPANEMRSHPVSKSVNVPDTDSAELIKPLNSL